MAVLHLSAKDFEKEVVQSDLPVLIDFWAQWCGPCRAIAPVIEEIADELAGKLKVGKVNVDEEQELAARFNVMSIPTLIILKGGEPIGLIVGAMSKAQLLERIKAKL